MIYALLEKGYILINRLSNQSFIPFGYTEVPLNYRD